jgi:hypothetical protein
VNRILSLRCAVGAERLVVIGRRVTVSGRPGNEVTSFRLGADVAQGRPWFHNAGCRPTF